MEIFVYSRGAVERVAPHDVPHVIISISSSEDDQARIPASPHCHLGPLRRGAAPGPAGAVRPSTRTRASPGPQVEKLRFAQFFQQAGGKTVEERFTLNQQRYYRSPVLIRLVR
ncbi:hypothetical protein [Polyangium sp. 15x6]|uniref:hypothetical protein n=1 Tax=Polyangium sp. 15x6 TaxID=3042687 RepID=UPI002499BD12|nr:hypothetical protein [Polyangium sp. 15x6]MDI3282146.1 hypothetical protein [Polyangium sp. 15x6]